MLAHAALTWGKRLPVGRALRSQPSCCIAVHPHPRVAQLVPHVIGLLQRLEGGAAAGAASCDDMSGHHPVRPSRWLLCTSLAVLNIACLLTQRAQAKTMIHRSQR